MPCLHLLLRLETRHLLGIRRRRTLGQRTRRGILLGSAQQAGKIGDTNQANDNHQRDDDGHTLP
jgi:hypothetical protein